MLVEQTCYNDRLQPAARRLGSSASTACAGQGADLLRLGFGYGAAAANNGNVIEQTIWAPDDGMNSAWQVAQAYTYDQVNRIATAAESKGGVQQWSRTYAYDHFGNRWLAGATGHTLHAATPTSSAQIEAATNRLASSTGAAYDAAGNMTAHPFITPGGGGMTYDANNKMTAFAATGVSVATKYDAEGRRVRKVHNGQTAVWVYDAFGKLAAEYTTAVSADTGVYYRTTDHLGSTRLTTNDAGEVVSRRDYFPFGERIDSTLSGRGGVRDGLLASYNASPGMRQQFTGQQRDDETGLDYFWERLLIVTAGRFTSADRSGTNELLDNPQSWNPCSYVENSPLRYVDPDGRAKCGDLPVAAAGFRPLRDVVLEDSDRGLLTRVVYAEGGVLRGGVNQTNGGLAWLGQVARGYEQYRRMQRDHFLIAATMTNRYWIANGYIVARRPDGSAVPASEWGFSAGDTSLTGIILHGTGNNGSGSWGTTQGGDVKKKYLDEIKTILDTEVGHGSLVLIETGFVNTGCARLASAFAAANTVLSEQLYGGNPIAYTLNGGLTTHWRGGDSTSTASPDPNASFLGQPWSPGGNRFWGTRAWEWIWGAR